MLLTLPQGKICACIDSIGVTCTLCIQIPGHNASVPDQARSQNTITNYKLTKVQHMQYGCNYYACNMHRKVRPAMNCLSCNYSIIIYTVSC